MNGRFELRWFAVFVFAVLAGCGENGQTVKDVDDATPGGGGDPTVPPPAQGSPGRLSLGATSITVGEGESVEIDVIRSGGTTGAVTVLVATHDGTAVAPADYSSVQTTVSFAAGDSAPKRVTVAVVDDSDDEPGETFSIVLSSPTGGATLGAAQEALITIQDNDVAAPTSPRAALSARYRRLRIDWTGVQDATTYRVLKETGQGAVVQIGSDLPADARFFEFQPVPHQERWSQLAYRVEACNSAGCARSEALSAAGMSTFFMDYLKSSTPGEFEYFGAAVALSGDGNTLAVGADSLSVVRIYTRTPDGWSAPTAIAAPTPDAYGFGEILALSEDGNTLAVGFTGEGTGGNSSGAVYVYMRESSGAWSATPVMLKASNPGTFDLFGSALALSSQGDVLAVGAPGEDGGSNGVNGAFNDAANGAGAVYVFRRTGASWSPATYVKAPQVRSGGQFGTAVALSGDGSVLAVGEPTSWGCAAPCLDSTGAVHVYATDDWSRPAVTLNPSGSSDTDSFGASVALSRDGTILAVGAPFESGGDSGLGGNPVTDCNAGAPTNCVGYAGAVFVYSHDGSGWSAPTYVKAAKANEYDEFGSVVALSADGNTLAAAAPYESGSAVGVDGPIDQNATGSGAVYVLTRSGSTWSAPVYVKASNTESYDGYGFALALTADGATLAVGAKYEEGAAAGLNGGNQIDDCDRPEEQRTNCAMASGAVYLY